GTTSGASKYIPISGEMIHSNRRAAFELLAHHVAHHRSSRVLGGKSFMLGGSTALTSLGGGAWSGDLSGIALRYRSKIFSSRLFPPPNIAAETDWDKKMDAIAELAPRADIRVLGGTPSWLLLLFERQQNRSGKSLAEIYPRLELLVHGGVNFAPYRRRFEQ